ncbi:MAG: hypothetical protein KAJ98_03120, partial [Spirochaetaceae bacterium]|nr:hypothetical protein [Spirochaetaceae bacterium]
MEKRKAGIGHWIVVVTLFILAIIMVYPLYNQLVISLTGPEHIAAADGATLIPRGFTLSTYTSVLA